jgi:hypothetical protein
MREYFSIIICGLSLLSGCGGGMSNTIAPDLSKVAAATAKLSPTTLTFGTEIVGSASPAQSVTLSNTGAGLLDITSIATTANFSQATNCGSTLASGTGCTISVTFTPHTSGSLDGKLSVADNAKGSPQSVSLRGTGTAAGPRCLAQGQECGVPMLPPCCPGLVCVPASTRAFCE